MPEVHAHATRRRPAPGFTPDVEPESRAMDPQMLAARVLASALGKVADGLQAQATAQTAATLQRVPVDSFFADVRAILASLGRHRLKYGVVLAGLVGSAVSPGAAKALEAVLQLLGAQ